MKKTISVVESLDKNGNCVGCEVYTPLGKSPSNLKLDYLDIPQGEINALIKEEALTPIDNIAQPGLYHVQTTEYEGIWLYREGRFLETGISIAKDVQISAIPDKPIDETTRKRYFDDEVLTISDLKNIVASNPKMELRILEEIFDDEQSVIGWETMEYASNNRSWLSSYFATPEQKKQYHLDGCKHCIQDYSCIEVFEDITIPEIELISSAQDKPDKEDRLAKLNNLSNPTQNPTLKI